MTTQPRFPHTPKLARLAALLVAGAIGASACGGDGVPIAAPADTETEAPDAVAAADETPADNGDSAPATPGAVAASVDTIDGLGDVLVGSNGLTLYGFTNDTAAQSTCYGTCADAWPPVIVDRDFTLAPALDVGAFATTEREDGTHQLVAGKWPLYFFAGDVIPGDANGQGSGDVWFTVDPGGQLITDASAGSADQAASDNPSGDEATAATVGSTDLGDALVDANGLTLYGFLDDTDSTPTCADACADAWPPLLVNGPDLPADLDPAVFSVAPRDDGTFQLVAGVWPLYRFAGDAGPGDINGQGSGDVWFVAKPDGKLFVPEAAEAEASNGYGSND